MEVSINSSECKETDSPGQRRVALLVLHKQLITFVLLIE